MRNRWRIVADVQISAGRTNAAEGRSSPGLRPHERGHGPRSFLVHKLRDSFMQDELIEISKKMYKKCLYSVSRVRSANCRSASG